MRGGNGQTSKHAVKEGVGIIHGVKLVRNTRRGKRLTGRLKHVDKGTCKHYTNTNTFSYTNLERKVRKIISVLRIKYTWKGERWKRVVACLEKRGMVAPIKEAKRIMKTEPMCRG